MCLGAADESLEEIKVQLQVLKPTLKEKYHVETLGIFGSYVRGEQTSKSDLDMIVEYSSDAYPSLFSLLELEEFLSEKIGIKVDLGTKRSLKPHIGKNILREIIYV